MPSIHHLFNTLVVEQTITVKSTTARDHENLRTRLCKLHSKHKKMLTSLGYSDDSAAWGLCAHYDDVHQLSTFVLKIPQKRVERDYELVS